MNGTVLSNTESSYRMAIRAFGHVLYGGREGEWIINSSLWPHLQQDLFTSGQATSSLATVAPTI